MDQTDDWMDEAPVQETTPLVQETTPLVQETTPLDLSFTSYEDELRPRSSGNRRSPPEPYPYRDSADEHGTSDLPRRPDTPEGVRKVQTPTKLPPDQEIIQRRRPRKIRSPTKLPKSTSTKTSTSHKRPRQHSPGVNVKRVTRSDTARKNKDGYFIDLDQEVSSPSTSESSTEHYDK